MRSLRVEPGRTMAPTLEQLEQRFADQTNGFHGELVDLNKSMSQVNTKLTGLLNLRNQLMGMYGVPPDPKWMPPAAPAKTPAKPKQEAKVKAPVKAKAKAKAAVVKPPSVETVARSAQAASFIASVCVPSGEVNYKGKLVEIIAKKSKKTPSKDDFTYVVEGEAPAGFTCKLTSTHLKKTYSTESTCASKRAAEHAAASAAIKAEFPEEFALLGIYGVTQGQKRKHEGEEVVQNDKSKLCQAMMVVLGRTLTKEDVTYEVTELPGDAKSYVATVKFPTWDKAKSFKGAAAPNKPKAEANAATVALQKLDSTFKPLLEEHQAKKKKKQQESLEKLKAAHEEKKKAKKEAEGAAPAAAPAAAAPAKPAAKPAAPKKAAEKKAAAKKK